MRGILKLIGGSAVLIVLSVALAASGTPKAIGASGRASARAAAAPAGAALSVAQQNALVQQYCVVCHNDAQKTGGLTLQTFDAAHPDADIVTEMAARLKSGVMPPAGMPRPDQATLTAFITALSAEAIGAPVTAQGQPAAEALPPLPAAVGAPKVISFAHTGDRMTVAAQNTMVHTICIQCHTDRRKPGNVSFEHLDMATATDHAPLAEDMIAKLRAGMMPPQSAPKRPDAASIHAFVVSLENRLDREAAAKVNPGARSFQRLNRVEYENTIQTLLGLQVDASQWLPPDTMSHNFDNIADVQNFSPTLLQSYLDAADEISRLAVGDRHAVTVSTSYDADSTASQLLHVPGAPYGTRGGISMLHTFPADATYRIRVLLVGKTTGELYGSTVSGEMLEIAIDGAQKALLPVNPRMKESIGPSGLNLEAPPIQITAGPHQVSAVFLARSDAA
ncbi:MAG TPA: DUF1587 domain-containing protein, partial [Vicinamibacterales bacterium]